MFAAIFVIITIAVVTFAVVGPWATITAFEAGRSAGWIMAWATLVAHAYTWYAMSYSSEALFCFGALWASYEFVCVSFAPLGVMEVEDEKAVSSAADKG